MDEKIQKIINRVLWIISIALVLQIGISSNLWLPVERTYPLVGLFEGLAFGNELTWFFSLSFIVGLIAITIISKWRYFGFWLIFPAIILLIIEDTTRLQVWMYIYLTLLGTIAWTYWQKSSLKTLPTLQFAIAMVYFWTGLQKLNPLFVQDVYSWLVNIFEVTKPLAELPSLGYLIGLGEALIGLGLLFPKTRKLGILLAIVLHLLILIFLIGDNYWNPIVYPWNVAMIGLVFVLFWNQKEVVLPIAKKEIEEDKPSINANKIKQETVVLPHYLILFFFGIFPLLDFPGIGIHQLSFSMYSGMEVRGYVYMNDGKAVEACLPKKLSDRLLEQSATETSISIDYWANKDMNAPSVGGKRVLYIVAKEVCACVLSQGQDGGLEMDIPNRWTGKITTVDMPCQELLTE